MQKRYFISNDFVGKNWGKEGHSKAALVVNDAVDYGKSRICEIMMESNFPNNVEIFKDIDTAKDWIQE